MGRRTDSRQRDLARIHCLKRDLRLDDDQYRTMLWVVARVETSAELDTHGRLAVIEHLEAHVAKAKGNTPPQYPGRPRNADQVDRRELKKIEALLTDAGLPWPYADSLARRMFRVERVAFCGSDQLTAIIAALHKKATKRLQTELLEVFGEQWPMHAAYVASNAFGFDAVHRSIGSYAQPMSLVLRWWRGEVTAACTWPTPDADSLGVACTWCRQRAR